MADDTMSTLGTYGPALATVLSGAFDYASKTGAGQALVTAADRKRTGEYLTASQLERNAGQQEAAGQYAAVDMRRQGAIADSRIVALAAAGGGATSDPTVMAIRARLKAEESYRAQLAVYQGLEAARGMREQAAAKRYMGDLSLADARDARDAADMSAYAGVAKTSASLLNSQAAKTFFSKYNDTGGGSSVDYTNTYGDTY